MRSGSYNYYRMGRKERRLDEGGGGRKSSKPFQWSKDQFHFNIIFNGCSNPYNAPTQKASVNVCVFWAVPLFHPPV